MAPQTRLVGVREHPGKVRDLGDEKEAMGASWGKKFLSKLISPPKKKNLGRKGQGGGKTRFREGEEREKSHNHGRLRKRDECGTKKGLGR